MCCCCPQGIQAILYLWIRAGCSKQSVAAALSYFPPEPPLYKIETCDESGVAVDLGIADNSSNTAHQEHRTDSEDDDGETKKSPVKMIMDRHENFREKAVERAHRDKAEKKASVTLNQSLTYKFICSDNYDIGNLKRNNVSITTTKLKGGLMVNTYRPLKNHRGGNKTILFSHGNATDLGGTHPIAVSLCKATCCNIVTYDYSGYGHSSGYPSEGNTYKDIQTVYTFCLSLQEPKSAVEENNSKRRSRNNKASSIILYGQSVGSGPSCWYLAKLCDKGAPPAGLILHCPFTSGIRVLTNQMSVPCIIRGLDIYKNIENIEKAKCPVFIMHGMRDEEVDIKHSVMLQDAVPAEYRRPPWWVPNRGHNDITDGVSGMTEYVTRVNTYLDSLD